MGSVRRSRFKVGIPGSHAPRGNPRPDALRRERVVVHDRAAPARRACKTWVPTRSVGARGSRGSDSLWDRSLPREGVAQNVDLEHHRPIIRVREFLLQLLGVESALVRRTFVPAEEYLDKLLRLQIVEVGPKAPAAFRSAHFF